MKNKKKNKEMKNKKLKFNYGGKKDKTYCESKIRWR